MTQRATGSAGVLAAAVGLVIAVWGALELAPSADAGPTTSSTAVTATASGASPRSAPSATHTSTARPAVPGFRADRWYLPDDAQLGFVEIPGGPFTMGSDPGVDPLAFDVEWWGDGRVQGIVDLPTFHLQRFEVTVAQYTAFVIATGHPVQAEALTAPPDHPVTSVSWTDAVAYARWLDGQLYADPTVVGEPLTERLRTGWRVTLPTEAQWEKAARGSDARIYPWGNEPRPDRANYLAAGPRPVGAAPCPECAFPLADMSGNVWEWTRSPYQPYPYDEVDDRANLTAEALWVMRGGSFRDAEQYIRTANRGGADPGARRPFIGFRVAIVRE